MRAAEAVHQLIGEALPVLLVPGEQLSLGSLQELGEGRG